MTPPPRLPASALAQNRPRRNTRPSYRTVRDLSDLDRQSPPTPGVDDTPYIRFAIEQLTFDEELMGRGRHSPDSRDSETATPTAHDKVTIRPVPITPPQQHLPFRPVRMSPPSSEKRKLRVSQVKLLPTDPPRDRHQLGYVPQPLRPWSLGLLIFICLSLIVLLVVSNVYGLTNHGLYDYDGDSSARYFTFEYLPPIVGTIVIFWLFSIQAAIYRIMPYWSMSSRTASAREGRSLHTMPITPANFVLPDWRFFGLKEPLVASILLVFWLSYWTVPLLSCLYTTQYYTEITPNRFRWTPVQGLGWFIMLEYLALVVALVLCMIKFRSQSSVLRWDPTSLADLIVLFQSSNILTDYHRSETKPDIESDLPPRQCRVGYWTTSKSPDFFYTVAEANQPYTEVPPTPERFGNEKYGSARTSAESGRALRDSDVSSFGRMLHSPYVRHRWCPSFLKDGVVLAWIIAALILLAAFLVVSFVNNAVFRGWFPLVRANTSADGFSPANFLYSFIPALLGMFLFLAWQPIDVYFRHVQPYVNMSRMQGAVAKRSILLSYNADLPLVVTIKALMNRDIRVAGISLVSTMSAAIPVLSGGVFTAQLFAEVQEVRMVASLAGYYALCVILSAYALSYLIIWPTRKRYLPHSIETVSGNLSFLYASRLLKDSSIRNIRTKQDLVARLDGRVGTNLTGAGAEKGSARDTGSAVKYGFGIFTGVDGREHLGIDRTQRPGSGEMLFGTGAGHRSRNR